MYKRYCSSGVLTFKAIHGLAHKYIYICDLATVKQKSKYALRYIFRTIHNIIYKRAGGGGLSGNGVTTLGTRLHFLHGIIIYY